MSEIMGMIIALLVLAYGICMILIPVAICRIWHWSFECHHELQKLNKQLENQTKK